MPSTNDVAEMLVEAQRSALQRVVSSSLFTRNPRLSALLTYLCEQRLRGNGDSPKEYAIATEVFGRPPDFDSSTDAIVRVEMYRLRKKLKEFYSQEGALEPIKIELQSGHYLPEFIERSSFLPAVESDGFVRDATAESPALKEDAEEVSTQPGKGSLRLWIWVPLAIALCLAVVLRFTALSGKKDQPAVADPQPMVAVPASPVAAPSASELRILCGSLRGGKDREGNVWTADAFYEGGEASQIGMRPVYRTRDPLLFRSMRIGEFSYNVPLRPGVYELRLFFSDRTFTTATSMEGGEGLRAFDVFANGKPLLKAHDILATAGVDTADVQVFKDIHPASDGYLHLRFARGQNQALVNAIEIEPGIPGHIRPIRLVTQESEITDRSGITWSSDSYFLNGRIAPRYGMVKGTEDSQVYDRERYGNFSYAIPVPAGEYGLRLHLAETYWGPANPGGGGVGSRLFDVYCNGTALLRNLDVFREAGVNTQVVKTFHNLHPNAQGTLLISFVPVTNYASVSALEVLDETK